MNGLTRDVRHLNHELHVSQNMLWAGQRDLAVFLPLSGKWVPKNGLTLRWVTDPIFGDTLEVLTGPDEVLGTISVKTLMEGVLL